MRITELAPRRLVRKAGAESQLGMAGEIRDHQQAGGEIGRDQCIEIGKQGVHHLHDLTAESVGIDKIDRRDETRPAPCIGPGIRFLPDQAVILTAQGELLEGGRGFRLDRRE